MQKGIDLDRIKRGVLIVVLLGILAVGVVIALTFDRRTVEALEAIDLSFLVLSLGAVTMIWLFSALPFYILSKVINKPISFSVALLVYLGGSFVGFITPFGSGLLPMQIYILTNYGFTAGQATALTSSRATISSWLFFVLGSVIFLAFRSSIPSPFGVDILLLIIVATAIWSLVTLFFIRYPESAKRTISRMVGSRILSKRVRENTLSRVQQRLFREIDFLSSNLRELFSSRNIPVIVLVFIIEAAAWLSLFAVLPLILFGFGVTGDIAQLLFRIFLLFSLVPASPTPGGSGVIELAFAVLLIDLVPRHILGLVVLIWRALTYYLTILVGGAIALRIITKSAFSKNSEGSQKSPL